MQDYNVRLIIRADVIITASDPEAALQEALDRLDTLETLNFEVTPLDVEVELVDNGYGM